MSKKTISTVLATVATTIAGTAAATENPFAMQSLASGYVTVAEAGKESKEMVCGEGKCGGMKMKNPEMNCGAMMEQAKKGEAQQGKAMEGKCAGMPGMGGSQNATPATPTPMPGH